MCIRDSPRDTQVRADDSPKYRRSRLWVESTLRKTAVPLSDCLLYTSDAADDLLCVDLGGRRIIKTKT